MTKIALAAGALLASAQLVAADLTIADARRVLDAARVSAKDLQAPGLAVSIVDKGGNILLVERFDDTFPAAAMIAIGKARTAALMQRSTAVLEEAVNGPRPALMTVPETNFTPVAGGIPLLIGGKVAGAIGVSGTKGAAQDEQVAVAAAAVLEKK